MIENRIKYGQPEQSNRTVEESKKKNVINAVKYELLYLGRDIYNFSFIGRLILCTFLDRNSFCDI